MALATESKRQYAAIATSRTDPTWSSELSLERPPRPACAVLVASLPKNPLRLAGELGSAWLTLGVDPVQDCTLEFSVVSFPCLTRQEIRGSYRFSGSVEYAVMREACTHTTPGQRVAGMDEGKPRGEVFRGPSSHGI